MPLRAVISARDDAPEAIPLVLFAPVSLAGWLAGCVGEMLLAEWFVWLAGWLVGCLVGSLALFVGVSVGLFPLVGRLVGWPAGWLVGAL